MQACIHSDYAAADNKSHHCAGQPVTARLNECVFGHTGVYFIYYNILLKLCKIQVIPDLSLETVTAEPHADYSKLASSDSLRSGKAALSVCCAESVAQF